VRGQRAAQVGPDERFRGGAAARGEPTLEQDGDAFADIRELIRAPRPTPPKTAEHSGTVGIRSDATALLTPRALFGQGPDGAGGSRTSHVKGQARAGSPRVSGSRTVCARSRESPAAGRASPERQAGTAAAHASEAARWGIALVAGDSATNRSARAYQSATCGLPGNTAALQLRPPAKQSAQGGHLATRDTRRRRAPGSQAPAGGSRDRQRRHHPVEAFDGWVPMQQHCPGGPSQSRGRAGPKPARASHGIGRQASWRATPAAQPGGRSPRSGTRCRAALG